MVSHTHPKEDVMNEVQRRLAALRAQAQRDVEQEQVPAQRQEDNRARPIEDVGEDILQPDRQEEEWETKQPRNWHYVVLGIVVLMGLIPLFYSKWGWAIWHYGMIAASVLTAIYEVKKLQLNWEMIVCHMIYKWKWIKIINLVWWFFLFWVKVNASQPYRPY